MLAWPLRTYRTRISAQLITSSCLVVVLTVVLIELAVLAIVIGWPDPDADLIINETLGLQAQLAASQLSEMSAASSLSEETVPVTDREALNRELDRIVLSGVPLYPGESALSLGEMPRAAIINRRGAVIASTSPAWAMPAEPYSNIGFGPARAAIARALELKGELTDYENSYVLDYGGDTMASAHPIMIEDVFMGILLLQADGVVDAREPSLLRNVARIGAINIIVFAALALPVLLIAIPVGIFRARRISRRLERLSDATTAMARGDLSQRVDIEGEDEVTQVGQHFNDMVSQLQEADRARRAFVSNVSHELRTPVAIIQGNLQQLLARAATERDPDTLETMHRETVTLSRLIDDLFTLARIEEAVLEMQPVPVNVGETISQAADGIRALAWEQRRVSVETMIPKDLPRALADNVRLLQILNNLLYNALRHTPEGGLIVISAARSGEEVEIAVADTGIGIPPEEIERIFDRFHQVEQSGRHHDGSGLGLAIVRQLVEAMGGRITVESHPDQGTTFRFTLPVAG